MKKKTFDLIRYVISVIIVITMFCFSYLILSNAYKSEEIDENNSFHNLPENTMDVIVLGSSHAQYSFSPAFFYQDTGLFSYVLGTQCQPLEVSYSMLKEALKTQSPKVIILEVFTAMPLKAGCDGISCYITAGYQMRGNERYDTLKKLPEEKYETYVNPFISSHNDWRTLNLTFNDAKELVKQSISTLRNKEKKNLNDVSNTFGFVDNYPTFPVDNSWYASTPSERIDVDLYKEDTDALNKIYNLCKFRHIELILYKTPIDSIDVENISYLNKVWEWADSNNIKYIDFIKESPRLDFQMWIQSDSFHSYVNGASIITSNLAKLVNEAQIEHNINEELEKMYYDSSNGITLTYSLLEYDPNKYFNRLINFKGPMLIVYNGEGYSSNSINSFLNKYNITGNGIVLVNNGQIIDSSDSCVGIEYMNKNIYADYDYMEIDGNVYSVDCGLSVVIFDSFMDKHYKIDTNLQNIWKNGYYTYGE